MGKWQACFSPLTTCSVLYTECPVKKHFPSLDTETWEHGAVVNAIARKGGKGVSRCLSLQKTGLLSLLPQEGAWIWAS